MGTFTDSTDAVSWVGGAHCTLRCAKDLRFHSDLTLTKGMVYSVAPMPHSMPGFGCALPNFGDPQTHPAHTL